MPPPGGQGSLRICCKQEGKEATRSLCQWLGKEGLGLTGASPDRAGHLAKRSMEQLPVRLLLATWFSSAVCCDAHAPAVSGSPGIVSSINSCLPSGMPGTLRAFQLKERTPVR